MKKNDYLLLTATGAYSFLFYQQNAGINFFLFNLVFLSVLLLRNRELLKSKKWCWAAAMCLISSACIFIHSSALSIVANVFSLILLAGVSFNTLTSALFAFLFSGFSVASSVVFMVIDAIRRSQMREGEAENKKNYKVFAGFIVLFLTILFFVMYKSANPLFAENTKWINLDFLSFQWIAFTIGGFILVYGLFYHQTISFIADWENNLSLHNTPATSLLNLKQFEAERFAGVLLFVMLNLMLLVLNIGDINTLYFLGILPKGISHSDFVHNGVGVIIFSIVVATALIMYLFRKDFKPVKHNALFKALAYAWIFQNILMLSSTLVRNQMYIHTFDFTYKRIGVYVWLILAVIGLVIMFLKLKQERSNWYLVKSNVAVWFSVLTLSSCFNWDKIITNYNLHNKPLSQVDFSYLLSLSEANIPELKAISETKDFKTLYEKETRILMAYQTELKNLTALNNYSTPRMKELEEQIKLNHNLFSGDRNYYDCLTDKIKEYVESYTNDWRSFDLRDKEITKSIYK
ncbi:MAG: hypothetical protein K0S53_988 [Bacteroidetes bacterium]|jgi:hypothetical protein|nr:hypothetical protein [Bacteroidota bacterium]